MEPVQIPQRVIDRVLRRRGKLHVYDNLDAPRTALLVVDLQVHFMREGSPSEMPSARAIVPTVNRLAGALRDRGGHVVWVVSTYGPEEGKELAQPRHRPGRGGCGGLSRRPQRGRRGPRDLAGARRARHRPGRSQEPVRGLHRQPGAPRTRAARSWRRHGAHRRHGHERLLRDDGTRGGRLRLQDGHDLGRERRPFGGGGRLDLRRLLRHIRRRDDGRRGGRPLGPAAHSG